MQKYNLHTHSVYCGHGEGEPDDYAQEAIKAGLTTLGFSEHLPFPDNRLRSTRMAWETKPVFEEEVRKTRARYADKGLAVLQGWECDYYEDMIPYYEELKESCDYLIVGVHYIRHEGREESVFGLDMDKKDLRTYADLAIKAITSGFFNYIAHPDVFFYRYPYFDAEAKAVSNDIIDAAIDMNIPLEANGNGITRESLFPRPAYPMREFCDLAVSKGAKIVAGADAHEPENVVAPLYKVYDFFSCYDNFHFAELSDII